MEGRWRRGRRWYHQRNAHEPGVYRVGWQPKVGGSWFVQIRVRGRLQYWGSFRSYNEAVAVARWVRARRDTAEVTEVTEVTARVEVPVTGEVVFS